MKPMKRAFLKQDNRLRMAYRDLGVYSDSKETPEDMRGKPYGDFIGSLPIGEEGRWDIYLLFGSLLSLPIRESRWNPETHEYEEYPCLIKELENRGYDARTLYFEIEKRNPNEEYRPIGDRFQHSSNPIKEYKKETKRMMALEIIKKKGIDTIVFNNLHDYDEYLEYCGSSEIFKNLFKYTKEEFDTLKEVLE